MPVGGAAIEKDVYVVDLKEVSERKVSCRVSTARERSKCDHEGSEGRGEREEREAEKGQRTNYSLFQPRRRPPFPLHHHSSTTSAAMGMAFSKALQALFGKKEMRRSSWNPHH